MTPPGPSKQPLGVQSPSEERWREAEQHCRKAGKPQRWRERRRNSLVPQKLQTELTSMKPVSGTGTSLLPSPQKWACLEIKQTREAHDSKTALFLGPQRRLAPLGDSRAMGGASAGPCSSAAVPSMLTAQLRVALRAKPLVLQMKKVSVSVCSSNPTSGYVFTKMKAGS